MVNQGKKHPTQKIIYYPKDHINKHYPEGTRGYGTLSPLEYTP